MGNCLKYFVDAITEPPVKHVLVGPSGSSCAVPISWLGNSYHLVQVGRFALYKVSY